MLLERLASGARIALERTRGDLLDDHALVALLLDPTVVADVREGAARRLRIGGRLRFRAVCSAPDATDSPMMGASLSHSTTLETSRGLLRATIETSPHPVGPPSPAHPHRGIGPWGELSALPRSWECAVIAWRLTTRLTIEVHFEELGAISELARIPVDEGSLRPPDIDEISALVESHPWASATLDALIERDTVRAASTLLGVHHSTVQARVEAIDSALGFSVTSSRGRFRLAVALTLYRLSADPARGRKATNSAKERP